MSEPIRFEAIWNEDRSGFVVNGPLTGDARTPGAVPLREDRATETDLKTVALRLAELNGETSDYKASAGGAREEYDRQADELLSLVFGEEASRG